MICNIDPKPMNILYHSIARLCVLDKPGELWALIMGIIEVFLESFRVTLSREGRPESPNLGRRSEEEKSMSGSSLTWEWRRPIAPGFAIVAMADF